MQQIIPNDSQFRPGGASLLKSQKVHLEARLRQVIQICDHLRADKRLTNIIVTDVEDTLGCHDRPPLGTKINRLARYFTGSETTAAKTTPSPAAMMTALALRPPHIRCKLTRLAAAKTASSGSIGSRKRGLP
jgi:hypothetical protein